MIIMPVIIPAAYHNHVQPKFTCAYRIIVVMASNRKTEPSTRNALMRNIIPQSTPSTESAARIIGSQGKLTLEDKEKAAAEIKKLKPIGKDKIKDHTMVVEGDADGAAAKP